MSDEIHFMDFFIISMESFVKMLQDVRLGSIDNTSILEYIVGITVCFMVMRLTFGMLWQQVFKNGDADNSKEK